MAIIPAIPHTSHMSTPLERHAGFQAEALYFRTGFAGRPSSADASAEASAPGAGSALKSLGDRSGQTRAFQQDVDFTMFRICKTEGTERSVLTVEGELRRDCVEALEMCCRQALGKHRPVEVFLRDVSAVDTAGRACLEKLAKAGIHLRGAGVYISWLLRGLEQPAAGGARAR